MLPGHHDIVRDLDIAVRRPITITVGAETDPFAFGLAVVEDAEQARWRALRGPLELRFGFDGLG